MREFREGTVPVVATAVTHPVFGLLTAVPLTSSTAAC